MKHCKVLGFLRDSAFDKLDAVQYYRTYLPLREVGRRACGIKTETVGKDSIGGLTDSQLGGRDIYTMCRMYHADCEGFIDEIHRRGGLLTLDSDDDLSEDYKLVSGRGKEFKRVLGMVDFVTVSTQPLADHFAQYTQKPPTVLRNHVDSEWMCTVADRGKRLIEGLTIGFSGSPTHWGDWYLPAVPFARIGRDFPEVTLITHGVMPRYLQFAAEQTSMMRLGQVPFVVYPVLLSQFDIVLCAVNAKDPFNAGKSAIKALECMSIGVVPICSRFGPYLDLEAAGAPVVVVEEDSRDGWYEAMLRIIRYEDRRKWLKGRGPVWVREHRDMAIGYRQWADFYHAIVD